MVGSTDDAKLLSMEIQTSLCAPLPSMTNVTRDLTSSKKNAFLIYITTLRVWTIPLNHVKLKYEPEILLSFPTQLTGACINNLRQFSRAHCFFVTKNAVLVKAWMAVPTPSSRSFPIAPVTFKLQNL